jgi:dihydropteroate synthase
MNTKHHRTINCSGTLVDLAKPKIMGILNLTPDSFFDGGNYNKVDAALAQCEKMIKEGVDFIDVGAYSSKPGTEEVSEEEELKRLLPTFEKLKFEFPQTLFSIDTFRSKVAAQTIDRGAALINDISAGALDPEMLTTIGKHQVPFIAMHMQGRPETMQLQPVYTNVVDEVVFFFSKKIKEAQTAGINDIIIDPGFGFGKTKKHNFELLKQLETFQCFDVPVLAGVSRKSMIYKTLNIKAETALNGTTVLHTLALSKKAQILRVHDVKEAKECINLLEVLQ